VVSLVSTISSSFGFGCSLIKVFGTFFFSAEGVFFFGRSLCLGPTFSKVDSSIFS
jgi:hypothetical protein